MLVVILIAIPGPFFVFRKADIDQLRRWLTGFFVTTLASLIGAIGTIRPGEVFLPSFFLILIFLMAAYAYLGVLALSARRLGKSAIVWWGVTFITSPIGYLVSYPMMLSRIRQANATATDAIEASEV